MHFLQVSAALIWGIGMLSHFIAEASQKLRPLPSHHPAVQLIHLHAGEGSGVQGDDSVDKDAKRPDITADGVSLLPQTLRCHILQEMLSLGHHIIVPLMMHS